ncbi:winged helix-turn-helix domain-containing protein [Streptomyces sp. KR80]|uniref:winged helix-turn-helix domain-containing protein n=1 Tax=Streptomyces sp. KR80 TaxID=3457426 RepID=UPI003FD351A6
MSQESTALNGHYRSYLQVAEALRARIHSGELRPGSRMPTQAKLAEEFGVERSVIRQALRVLQDENLLTNVSRGSPATVAEIHTGEVGTVPRPQPATVGLASRVVAAFEARHVRIDALCLTAETLSIALAEPIRQVHAGLLRPETVKVRVLLPSRDINLAFPVRVGDHSDDRPHRHWLNLRNFQGQALRGFLQSLRSTPSVTDVSVTFRALPFTPPVKMYILNNREALFGYYMITQREEEIEHEPVEMFDALGMQSMLFPFQRTEAESKDGTFVEQSQLWFNALWETITTDLTLAE